MTSIFLLTASLFAMLTSTKGTVLECALGAVQSSSSVRCLNPPLRLLLKVLEALEDRRRFIAAAHGATVEWRRWRAKGPRRETTPGGCATVSRLHGMQGTHANEPQRQVTPSTPDTLFATTARANVATPSPSFFELAATHTCNR